MKYGMRISVSAALIMDGIKGHHLHLLSLLSGHSQRWLHPRKIFPLHRILPKPPCHQQLAISCSTLRSLATEDVHHRLEGKPA